MQQQATCQFSEKSFDVCGLKIQAALWERGGPPVIALHGWLDNLAGFLPLADRLDSTTLLALDLAGHGKSSHRSADASYHIWDDLREILAVADQMGWERFSLLGHSRGGIIACLLAACFPERVTSLFLIEGFWPLTSKPGEVVTQLRKSLLANAWPGDQKAALPRTLEQLCSQRSRSLPGVEATMVKDLVNRSVSKKADGFCWSFDRRLQFASPLMLSDEQVETVLSSITCPVELFVGSESMGTSMQDMEEKLSFIPNLVVTTLEGGHHPHLQSGVETIAERLSRGARSRS